MAKAKNSSIGSWAFLIGVLLALVLSFVGPTGYDDILVIVLVVIGLLVGLLNITGTETTPFLMSGLVLIIASALGQSSINDVQYASAILQNLMVIFVPATIIVAIRNVFSLAKS